MQDTKTKSNISAWIAGLILFYLSAPYFVWHGLISSIYVKTVLSLVVGALFWMNRKNSSLFESLLFIILLAALLVYVITGGYNLNYFILLFPVVFIPFATDDFDYQVFRVFTTVYVFIITISLLSWLLAIVGIIHPYKSIGPLNSLKPYNYNVYPFYVNPSLLPIIRFYGPFDEPGVVGTLSGLLLCVEKFNLKNRKTVILLVSGLCSLSFFFFLTIGVYFLLYFAFQVRSFSKTIYVIIAIVAAIYVLQSFPVLYDTLGVRFEWDADKNKFSGDSRISYEIVEDVFNSIKGTKEFWFGIKDKEGYMELVEGSSSFMTVIVLNGLIFTILYFLFFILYALYYNNNIWSVLLFLFVFFGTIYQRPNTFQILYVFLFIYLARVERMNQALS